MVVLILVIGCVNLVLSSIHQLKTGMSIDFETGQPCCFNAPLSLVYMNLGTNIIHRIFYQA